MITKLSVRNFKCLRDVTVDLERFTVFVGPNASGKSSILQALDLLCRIFRTDPQQRRDGSALEGLLWASTKHFELAAAIQDKAFRYRSQADTQEPVEVQSKGRYRPYPYAPPDASATAKAWNGGGHAFATSLTEADWQRWEQSQHRPPELPVSCLLRLETSRLIASNAAPDPTTMSPDGTGLHSALANIALSDPESWQVLQKGLGQIVPTIRRLRHTMKSGSANGPALLFDTVGADALLANQVSEGTLLVLGLLAALHGAERPNLVMLDDLDRGLHPKAQKKLIALLRGLLETNPELQIVATTHSPYMLDCMEVNEVRMTTLKDDGSTACAALTDHPKFPKWKDEMTPGEMWSLFGEKWITEGVTA